MAGRDDIVVVLVNTRNPLNIGAAARAMSNFGFTHLRVVKPYEPSFREARSAVGAAEVLAQAKEFPSVADAVADCTLVVGTTAATDRYLQQPLRRLEDGARLLRKQRGRVAVLFGSEKRGLSNADLSHCHWAMRIQTVEQQPSLNLGHAVAVCLYELARPEKVAPQSTQLASAGELERISDMLFEILQESGWVKPRAADVTEEKVRRLVRRMGLQAADAEVWMGMLRQIGWKVKKK